MVQDNQKKSVFSKAGLGERRAPLIVFLYKLLLWPIGAAWAVLKQKYQTKLFKHMAEFLIFS